MSPLEAMKIRTSERRCVTSMFSILVAVCLLLSACGDSEDPALDDGSLGVVTVDRGDAVQIRSVSAFDLANPEALDYFNAVQFAIENYGPIHGEFTVELGEAINDACSAEDGPATAEAVLADENVLGAIGTSCSATATTAVPMITAAGMVVISMSNTSPVLTSDLAGNRAEYHQPGYYRTAHNDLYQGEAVAAFLHDSLGPQEAAVVHEGDAYTQGLAQAFSDAFERHGGTITDFIEIDLDTTDLPAVLTQIAAKGPAALFFPLNQDAANALTAAVRQHVGFEDTVLLSGDGVLHYSFLESDSSAGVFISGPDLDFGDNANQATGMNAEQVTERFIDETGAPPVRAFWAHAYDATTLLLDAITAASRVDGDKLVIDRAGIRQYLNQVGDYQGIIGELSCDEFGDCGSGKVSIIQHLDPTNPDASWDNVVYRFSP
ncbi:MAG: branched-chain amino acid ABC transporter substrate-binding protein [Acidimicrobiaceae bacterium]|nr:branched-chain amino acid ABC transporter substrate-binding protein [Acidimicrobiaceae bacterium]